MCLYVRIYSVFVTLCTSTKSELVKKTQELMKDSSILHFSSFSSYTRLYVEDNFVDIIFSFRELHSRIFRNDDVVVFVARWVLIMLEWFFVYHHYIPYHCYTLYKVQLWKYFWHNYSMSMLSCFCLVNLILGTLPMQNFAALNDYME